MKNNYPGRITRPGRHAHVRSNTGVSSWHGRRPLTLLCGALLAASSVHVAHAQVADTLGEQEQRRRAQEQAIERERTLQAPKVELQAAARPEIDDGNPNASFSDRSAAHNVLKDLQNALNRK